MKETVQFLLLAGVVLVALTIALVPAWFIFRRTSRKPFTVLEGAVSHIRTTTSVEGTIRKGKGSISSTTTTHLRINDKAAFADFGEQMNVSDGDVLRVAGDAQANGLYIMAYRNLTNGTHGAGGGASTVARLGSGFICAMGAAICFIPGGGFIGGVPGMWLGLWLLGMHCRYRAALRACLASSQQ